MNFDILLQEYEQKIDYVKRMTVPDALSFYHKTKDYWHGYLQSTFDWFQNMKYECEDFKPSLRPATQEEQRLYQYCTANNDIRLEWPLMGMLDYRQEHVPVYNDDNGQQFFAVYKNHEIIGGSYNYLCEYDFCYEIDRIKDLNSLNQLTGGI